MTILRTNNREQGSFTLAGILSLFLSASFLILPSLASAADASLFFSPITGTYTTGEEISVKVMLSTGGDSANAVEGTIRFDPKNIEILSVDRSSSFLTSWTQEPLIDNAEGKVSFAGSMSGTSSYAGPRGEILTLALKGLRSEETRLHFDSGSASAVHAADGTGGNLLSALSNGVYLFTPKENSPPSQVPTEVASAGGEVLGAATGTPIVTSSTHPDQTRWYNATMTKVSWEMPEGVRGVFLALDRKSDGEGVVYYSAPKDSKEVDDLGDGVWYMHVTREWEDGHKDTTPYRIAVDTVPPDSFSVSEIPRSEGSNPNALFLIQATDTLSGVDHYEISIDGGTPLSWTDDGSHTYRAPGSTPGDHTLLVAAVDQAGNRTPATAGFHIDPLSSPQIARASEETLHEGDRITLSLSGVPRAAIVIAIARDSGIPVQEEYTLDETGQGTFASALVTAPGVYRVFATARQSSGAISAPSETIEVVVETSFIGILKRHPMIPLAIGGLVALFFLLRFFWNRTLRDDGSSEEEPEEDDETPALSNPMRVHHGGTVDLRRHS